ncbi:MAG: FAD-binding oxidoreductase [Pseudomonadota bacterium]
MHPSSRDPSLIAALRGLVGEKAVIDGPDRAPLLEEWRGRWQGETPLILAPGSTDELSRAMAYCHQNDIPMVPQGGNTGLVGGQIPHGEVLISTRRMRTIRDVSPTNFTMTAEAGVLLADAQNAASSVSKMFPLSIGSEGSCTIGGVLSTNAGGIQVIRHGNARDLALGLEVVLPDGRIWNGLNNLRKNNVGYDLKHLFIGGEGTLGVISAAVLKLSARPHDEVTTLLAVPSAQAAVDLLSIAQDQSGGQVGSFELMNSGMVSLVTHHFPTPVPPPGEGAPYYVLVTFEAGQEGTLEPLVGKILEYAMDKGLVLDGTIAASQAQTNALWAMRHHASEAMKRDGRYCVKCDISVPINAIPSFLDKANTRILNDTPGARIIAFGHLGDGNIHYDVLGPFDDMTDAWKKKSTTTERLVHDIATHHQGSISAEHGIGVLKKDELAERQDATARSLMQAVKQAIDPKGLMNPGKLIA